MTPFKLRPNPHLLEINAWTFLRKMRSKYKKPLTLNQIPFKEWKLIASRGFDAVWLMGIWTRSPQARRLALFHPELNEVYDRILPGWKIKDVSGSPYAIYDYKPDPYFGESLDLASLKERLNRLGLGLILDYVPNHRAMDHPWTVNQSECFLQVTEEQKRKYPDLFFNANGRHFAYGKDPYFAPWKDTVQVNYFNPRMREMSLAELTQIAGWSDGVRCDMAMLALNEIFKKTWGFFLNGTPVPKTEFWREMIAGVKKNFPNFIFMAEAYWDKEWELQQLGFDYTYDKKLYDRLLSASPDDIAGHLQAEIGYQERSVRFIENHDEPRAVVEFGLDKSLAAASVMGTIPGLRFYHDGQAEGKKIHLPVQLGTEPDETPVEEAVNHYAKLFEFTHDEVFHRGKWQFLQTRSSWEGNDTYKNYLCWAWEWETQLRLVTLNYSGVWSQARLTLPWTIPGGQNLKFHDVLTGADYLRNAEELSSQGLYLELAPWKAHFFKVQPAGTPVSV